MCNIQVSSILDIDLANGPGVRTTIFLQGCTRHCKGCHNPSTWNPTKGYTSTVAELFDHIKVNHDIALKRGIDQGLTISGGEPLLQAKALVELLTRVRDIGVDDIWMWTGYNSYDELTQEQRDAVDLCTCVVFGEFKQELASSMLAYRGSSNQRILRVDTKPHTDITDAMDNEIFG